LVESQPAVVRNVDLFTNASVIAVSPHHTLELVITAVTYTRRRIGGGLLFNETTILEVSFMFLCSGLVMNLSFNFTAGLNLTRDLIHGAVPSSIA